MNLASLKRWHWVVVALVVGLAHGYLRQGGSSEGRLDRFEVLLTDAGQFERALVSEVQGRRLFEHVRVYPYRLGPGREVHLVTGRYWDGQPRNNDGQLQAHWVQACFVAPVPYSTHAVGDAVTSKGYPSVLNYLRDLERTAGVKYQYAWWWWMEQPLFISTVTSLVLIGGLWPTIICLLTFGTLTRPREVKGSSLWGIRGSKPSSRPTAAGAGAAVSESETGHPAPEHIDVALPPPDSLPAVSALPGTPLEPALPVTQWQKEYGKGGNDFYPTELHLPPSRASEQ